MDKSKGFEQGSFTESHPQLGLLEDIRSRSQDAIASFKRSVKPKREFDVSDRYHHRIIQVKNKPKRTDSTVALPSAPLPFLIQPLLRQLCLTSTRNETEASELYKRLQGELIKHQLIEPSTLHDQDQAIAQGIFNKIIRTALKSLSVDQSATFLAFPFEKSSLNLLCPTSKEEDIIRRNIGRYRNEFKETGILGKGGFGSVFKAKHYFDGKEYAVKKIRFMQKQSNMIPKTLREVEALASLQHPNIVGYNSAWMEYDGPFSGSSSSGSPRSVDDSDSDEELMDLNNNDSGSSSIEFLDDSVPGTGAGDTAGPWLQPSALAGGVGGMAQAARRFSSVKVQEISVTEGLPQPAISSEKSLTGRRLSSPVPNSNSNKSMSGSYDKHDKSALSCSNCGIVKQQVIDLKKERLANYSNKVGKKIVKKDNSVNYLSKSRDLKSHHLKGCEVSSVNDQKVMDSKYAYNQNSHSDYEFRNLNSSKGFSLQQKSTNSHSFKKARNLNKSKFYDYSNESQLCNAPVEYSRDSQRTSFLPKDFSPFPATTFIIPKKESDLLMPPVLYSSRTPSLKITPLDNTNDEIENSNKHNQAIVLRKQHPAFGRSVSLGGHTSGFDIRNNTYSFQPSITLFIQMELCSLTLQEWLVDRNSAFNSDYNQMSKDNMRVFRQLLEGVNFIHRNGLIHRDLKPRNIFLLGNELHVKIGDFGLVKSDALQSDGNTIPCSFNVPSVYKEPHTTGVGTSAYASPEQLKGSVYDSKSDMYSLGVVLYEMYHTYSTEMERAVGLAALRDSCTVEGEVWGRWPQQAEAMVSLTSVPPAARPSSGDLLASDMFLSHQQQVHQLQQTVAYLRQQLHDMRLELAARDRRIQELTHPAS